MIAMKTILGHCRDFIFVCCLVGFCPYLAQSSEESKLLKGIVGGSVTFPAPVMKTGFLQCKDLGTAAFVLNGSGFTVLTKLFSGRLQWNSQTGLFTIIHLRTEDSGKYEVDCKDEQKKPIGFQLEVYKNMSAPTVTWLQLGRNCSVLCSVVNGREVTLSWQREGEVMSSTSSPDINGSLILPLKIDNKNHSYSCEAKNPVSLQRSLLDIPFNCAEDSDSEETTDFAFPPLLIALPVMAVTGLAVLIVLRKCMKSEDTGRREEERVRYKLHCDDVSTKTHSKVKQLLGGAVSKLDSPTEVALYDQK